MKTEDIKTIGVIGTGTMGRGIAISTSQNGFDTILYDISKEITENSKLIIENEFNKSVLKKKLSGEDKNKSLSRLKYTVDLNELSQCDIIIEAASEDINIKKDIFSRLDKICKPKTILASNTSSLSITSISSYAGNHKDKVIGLHFFNPANIMKLVEVIKGNFTGKDTIKSVMDFSREIKKVPVIAEDTPAFIVNRIARPFYGEALKILSEGTSDIETIDKVMKSCGSFAMGPFELMDLIGIDINFSVTKSVYEAFFNDPKYRPNFIQKKMVDAGLLGKKTKRGFYSYD